MAERWGALPLGEPCPCCVRCGAVEEALHYSEAYGWLCNDAVACERRHWERHRRIA